MSKFTKYMRRALEQAKPEKEAGLLVGVTKEGDFIVKLVGDPKASAQMLLYAAQVDDGMNEFMKYLCATYKDRSGMEVD